MELAIQLLAAYLVAEFVFLSEPDARNRHNWGRVGMVHILAALVVAPLFAPLCLPVLAGALHLGLRLGWGRLPAAWNTHDDPQIRRRRRLTAFVVRHALHIAMVLLVSRYAAVIARELWVGGTIREIGFDVRPGDALLLETAPLTWICGPRLALLTTIVAAGFVIAVCAGARLIEILVDPFVEDLNAARKQHPEEIRPRGFPDGARVIGHWERAIIFLLVSTGHVAGVTFLAAAKSIFRFGELKDASQRREAEFILIGTLMSFSWALGVALLTKYAAAAAVGTFEAWPP